MRSLCKSGLLAAYSLPRPVASAANPGHRRCHAVPRLVRFAGIVMRDQIVCFLLSARTARARVIGTVRRAVRRFLPSISCACQVCGSWLQLYR